MAASMVVGEHADGMNADAPQMSGGEFSSEIVVFAERNVSAVISEEIDQNRLRIGVANPGNPFRRRITQQNDGGRLFHRTKKLLSRGLRGERNEFENPLIQLPDQPLCNPARPLELRLFDNDPLTADPGAVEETVPAQCGDHPAPGDRPDIRRIVQHPVYGFHVKRQLRGDIPVGFLHFRFVLVVFYKIIPETPAEVKPDTSFFPPVSCPFCDIAAALTKKTV